MARKTHVATTINGEAVEFLCEARQSLLEVLRDTLRPDRLKEGCNNGNCGACTVLLDGLPVDSCLVLAVEVEGAQITTIEGIAARLASASRSSNVSWKMRPCNAASARPASSCRPRRCWIAIPNPSEHEIRFQLAGNLCRCTGYDKIVRAVQDAAKQMAAGAGPSRHGHQRQPDGRRAQATGLDVFGRHH